MFVESEDEGRSWRTRSIDGLPLDPRWAERSAHRTEGWPVALPDGQTLINVVGETRTPAQHRQRLQNIGLGHLWREDSTFGWDLHPAEHTERLRAAGAYVFDAPVRHHPDLPPESSFRVCFMFGC